MAPARTRRTRSRDAPAQLRLAHESDQSTLQDFAPREPFEIAATDGPVFVGERGSFERDVVFPGVGRRAVVEVGEVGARAAALEGIAA